ncbi:MAG: hypothetical protein D6760_12825, partial [Deltaproteobacteria bacterium]
MTDLAEQTISLAGKSGNRYEFALYSLDYNFVHTKEAVYVVGKTKVDDDGSMRLDPTFCGETDNLGARMLDHRARGCFEGNDSVGVYAVLSDALRIAIVNDLRAGGMPE